MPFVDVLSAALTAGGDKLAARQAGGKVRVASAVFTYAADVAGTYTSPIILPAGATVLGVALNADTSSGTTTIAIGIPGTAGKYRAAATYTTTDTLTWVALNAATGVPLAAQEQIIITTAAATAPSSGRLLIYFLYADNS